MQQFQGSTKLLIFEIFSTIIFYLILFDVALHFASISGSVQAAEELVVQGAQIDAPDFSQLIPLHYSSIICLLNNHWSIYISFSSFVPKPGVSEVL